MLLTSSAGPVGKILVGEAFLGERFALGGRFSPDVSPWTFLNGCFSLGVSHWTFLYGCLLLDVPR